MSGHPRNDDQDSAGQGHSALETYLIPAILALIVVIAIAYGLSSGGNIIGFEVTHDKGAGH